MNARQDRVPLEQLLVRLQVDDDRQRSLDSCLDGYLIDEDPSWLSFLIRGLYMRIAREDVIECSPLQLPSDATARHGIYVRIALRSPTRVLSIHSTTINEGSLMEGLIPFSIVTRSGVMEIESPLYEQQEAAYLNRFGLVDSNEE